jgi:hypothetical protein
MQQDVSVLSQVLEIIKERNEVTKLGYFKLPGLKI